MPNYKELVFVPLGGVGEIGMNLALYGLRSGHEREWLCVDMGISFADAEIPGVEIILPDTQFLEKERKNLKGIASTELTNRAMREADTKKRSSDFLGLKK